MLFWCFILTPVFCHATHIAGGEITYKYLDTNKYLVRLTLFVDCFNGSTGAIALDSNAVFAYFDADTDTLINFDEIERSNPTRIEELHYNCVKFTSDACVDRYIYEYEKSIDPGRSGIIIAFQRCCRNGTITNLLNPQDAGATYWAYIPPDTVVSVNSSPYFTELPPNFLCTNAPLIFDHSAIDPDGDSLAYTLVSPFDGADPFNPRPVPASNPPYSEVIYRSPYNISQMMGAKSGLTIDVNSGELRVTPESIGQFVVGIKVSEYRNGVLLSEVIRDYQFNVYNCEFETQANFINPDRVCHDTVYFKDKSSKAQYYSWDFGVTTRSDDTSSAVNPYWLYPDDGKYKVTLIVGNLDCMDTFYNFVTIVHADSIHALFDPGSTNACDELNICVENQGDKTPDWYWDWGDGSAPIHNKDTLCHLYDSFGTYLLTLSIIDSTKCNIADTFSVPLQVFESPVAGFIFDTLGCNGLVSVQNESEKYTSLKWYFEGLEILKFDEENPSVNYIQNGTFNIELTVYNDNCSDTTHDSVEIDLNNFVSADILPQPGSGCAPVIVNFSTPSGVKGYNTWDMGDGNRFTDTMISSYEYTSEGTYTITFEVTDSSSCNRSDRFEYTFTVEAEAEPGFVTTVDECSGEVILENNTTGGKEDLWNFGDGVYSTDYSTEHIYTRSGTYKITLHVDSTANCPSSVSKVIDLDFAGLSELFIPNIFTPNDDSRNDCYSISGVKYDCYDYSFILYNRWGELVFESDDIRECWDGNTRDGKPFPEGTYFAIYLFKESGSDVTHNFSGTITLIR